MTNEITKIIVDNMVSKCSFDRIIRSSLFEKDLYWYLDDNLWQNVRTELFSQLSNQIHIMVKKE
jgi:hypothetical protein